MEEYLSSPCIFQSDIEMPLLSSYVFDQADFQGNFTYSTSGLFVGDFSYREFNNQNTSSIIVVREDRETRVEPSSMLNSSQALGMIDQQLGGRATRTSQVFAGWMTWKHVPYHEKDPNRHDELDQLLRILFNFHINTPPGCVDIDGNISYYVQFFLDDAGRLNATVDWWAYQFWGGHTVFGINCGADEAKDALDKAVPAGIGPLQDAMNNYVKLVALFDAPVHDQEGRALFDKIYWLPGDGTRSLGEGSGTTPVENLASLALLPKQTQTPQRIHVDAKLLKVKNKDLKIENLQNRCYSNYGSSIESKR